MSQAGDLLKAFTDYSRCYFYTEELHSVQF